MANKQVEPIVIRGDQLLLALDVLDLLDDLTYRTGEQRDEEIAKLKGNTKWNHRNFSPEKILAVAPQRWQKILRLRSRMPGYELQTVALRGVRWLMRTAKPIRMIFVDIAPVVELDHETFIDERVYPPFYRAMRQFFESFASGELTEADFRA